MDPTETQEEMTTVQEERPQKVVRTTKQVTPAVHTEHPQKVFNKKKTIFRYNQIIWYILVLIEILIFFRAIFKMIGANSTSGFVSFIYGITEVLVFPFRGIVTTTSNNTSIFEWYLIFAAVVYLLIAAGITYLAQFIKPLTPREVEEGVD